MHKKEIKLTLYHLKEATCKDKIQSDWEIKNINKNIHQQTNTEP